VSYGIAAIASAYNERAFKINQYLRLCGTTFLHVDQNSPHLLENFGEDIPTSMEVTESQALNFKQNFKYSRFLGGPRPRPVWVCAR